MQVERNRFNRYQLKSDALYLFVHDSMIPWEVRDISMGGLSFQYSPVRGEEIESGIIDIVDSHYDQFDLTNIMCRMVYDNLDLSEGLRFRGKETRRRGLEFDDLTETQTRSLDLLIGNLRLMFDPLVRVQLERQR